MLFIVVTVRRKSNAVIYKLQRQQYIDNLRIISEIRIIVQGFCLNPNLFNQSMSLKDRKRNHHSIHLRQNSVAGRQTHLLQILDEHIVMPCSLLETKGCQLTLQTNPKCSGECCQYYECFSPALLLRSQYNYIRLNCGLWILVQRWGLNPYLFRQSMLLQTEVATTIPSIQGKIVSLVDRLVVVHMRCSLLNTKCWGPQLGTDPISREKIMTYTACR